MKTPGSSKGQIVVFFPLSSRPLILPSPPPPRTIFHSLQHVTTPKANSQTVKQPKERFKKKKVKNKTKGLGKRKKGRRWRRRKGKSFTPAIHQDPLSVLAPVWDGDATDRGGTWG